MNSLLPGIIAVLFAGSMFTIKHKPAIPTASQQEIQNNKAKMVYLKSGGEFANWCQIVTGSDYDRAVNIRNIATLRKIGDKRLLVDNNLVILFSDNAEREAFIKAVAE